MTDNAYYYYNILDETYKVCDSDGFIWGIGTTLREAVENAEFWGLNCNDLEEMEW